MEEYGKKQLEDSQRKREEVQADYERAAAGFKAAVDSTVRVMRWTVPITLISVAVIVACLVWQIVWLFRG